MVPSMSSSSSRAFAGKAAQAAQGDLDVARAEFHRVVEVAVLAVLPDLDAGAVAGRGAADADAFRVVTAVAEGRAAAGTDPLAAAGMAFLLLGEALLEFLHQLVPAELFQLGLFLGRQMLFHHHLQPFFGDVGFKAGNLRHALEVLAEGAVELVVVRFVLDQAGAGKEVEIVDRIPRHMLLQRFQQREELARGHRQLFRLEVEEEVDQHGKSALAVRRFTRLSGCGGP
jgi:hypothetical protein